MIAEPKLCLLAAGRAGQNISLQCKHQNVSPIHLYLYTACCSTHSIRVVHTAASARLLTALKCTVKGFSPAG